MEGILLLTGAARGAPESRAGEGLKRGGARLSRPFGAHRYSQTLGARLMSRKLPLEPGSVRGNNCKL